MSIGFGGDGLGSLAQSARTKQLKNARAILLFCGILTIVVNLAFVAAAESMVKGEIEKELEPLRAKGMVIDQAKLADLTDSAVRTTRLINGAAVLIGVIFVVCGIVVYQFPVPATIISLVLYLGATAVFGYLNPASLAMGWIVKILIVVGLFKAVQAAVAYENERKATSTSPLLGDLPTASV